MAKGADRMSMKWIGAILVIVGCGGVGFSMAVNYKKEVRAISAIISVLDHMHSELTYRLSPLADVFYKVSNMTDGCIGKAFYELAAEMERQISPDAGCCMEVVLQRRRDIPELARQELKELGKSLGRFDLEGQVREIAAARERCARQLDKLSDQKEDRIRQYQTLGFCAGAAIVILLI